MCYPGVVVSVLWGCLLKKRYRCIFIGIIIVVLAAMVIYYVFNVGLFMSRPNLEIVSKDVYLKDNK